MDWVVVTWLGAIAIVVVVAWVSRARRPDAGPRPTLAELHRRLDDADLLLQQGNIGVAGNVFLEIEVHTREVRGPEGAYLRARFHVVGADYGASTDQRAPTEASLRAGLKELQDLEDDRATELRARAQACLGLMSNAEDDTEELRNHGEAALAVADRVKEPETFYRLCWVSRRLGEVCLERGDWIHGRRHLEQAIELAERIELPKAGSPMAPESRLPLLRANARAEASGAALVLGNVRWSSGDREAGLAGMDRAIQLVEGLTQPGARLARAKALHVRAACEPDTPLADPGVRVERLQQAVADGLGCGWVPAGRLVAAQAEISAGTTYLSIGVPGKAAEFFQRAITHVADLKDAECTVVSAQARFLVGYVHEELGEAVAARDAYKEAWQRGKAARAPEARRFATIAAHRLHLLLFEEKQLDEARMLLGEIDDVVPTMPSEWRQIMAGYAMRCRAFQNLGEERGEQVIPLLENAVSIGNEVRNAEGWTLARRTLGDLGAIALQNGDAAAAEEHFRRALELPYVPGPGLERAERAGLIVQLGRTLAELGRTEAALGELRRAFALGRDSGHSRGREVAALAAFSQADLGIDATEERRKLYQVASQLGRLSGLAGGRRVAEAVEARLRDLTS